jgi:hypothetical protein
MRYPKAAEARDGWSVKPLNSAFETAEGPGVDELSRFGHGRLLIRKRHRFRYEIRSREDRNLRVPAIHKGNERIATVRHHHIAPSDPSEKGVA